MYLSLAAVLVFVLVIVHHLWGRWFYGRGNGGARRQLVARTVFGLAVVTWLGILGSLTIARNRDYRTWVSMWQDAVLKRPNNATARNYLGNALLQDGRVAEAMPYLEEAIQFWPDSAGAHSNYGDALLKAGKVEESILHCRRAVELRPEFAAAHNNLGNALLAGGHLDESIAAYRRATELNPAAANMRGNLGVALRRKGLLDEAIEEYRKALKISPEFAVAHFNLGNVYAQKQQMDQAIAEYEEALRIHPAYPAAHGNLGDVLVQSGRANEAARHYEQALEFDPKNISVLNNHALLLATCSDANLRDGSKAVELARRAIGVGGESNLILLHTLMVAQAAAGDMNGAIQTAERAQSLALAQGQSDLADTFRQERDQFRAQAATRRSESGAP
jgi:tetratricopeptide (TPR) repeat protein